MKKSVDIYVTYKCNLRCSHCFVGDKLEASSHFDIESVYGIIDNCASWGVDEVTFLGGEPTLYPWIKEAITRAVQRSITPRIVTNGLKPFGEFLDSIPYANQLEICFSLDAANLDVYKKVRGGRGYDILLKNIMRARDLGFSYKGILSLSKQNINYANHIVSLASKLGMESLNVHYVSNRGFAKQEDVIEPEQWILAYHELKNASCDNDIQIRAEQTFFKKNENKGACSVKDDKNLMFFPDGRVHACSMFIGYDDYHSYIWDGKKLVENVKNNEKQVCQK